MDLDKVKEVVGEYASGILKLYASEQMEEAFYDQTYVPTVIIMCHLRWMCDEILAGRVVGDKAHRWLGYI